MFSRLVPNEVWLTYEGVWKGVARPTASASLMQMKFAIAEAGRGDCTEGVKSSDTRNTAESGALNPSAKVCSWSSA